MGAWGLASDENDKTFQKIGFKAIQWATPLLHPLSIPNHVEFMNLIYKASAADGDELTVGMAIFCLKMGCGLRKSTLQNVLVQLQKELDEKSIYSSYIDKKGRLEVVKYEIDMVKAAMKNKRGWTSDEYIVGVRGVVSGGTHGKTTSDRHPPHPRPGTPVGKQPQLAQRNQLGLLEHITCEN